MSLSLEQLIDRISDSGLLSADDLDTFIDSQPDGEKPADAETLAKALVDAGKLTAYQAKRLWQGKLDELAIGNYFILDKLGQGGMGMVFHARHRTIGRQVAIKILAPNLTDSAAAVKRFHREVQAAARLTHPNIVAAFDADEDAGTHYLVMEYVDGRDLAEIVKQQGPLGIDQTVSCIVQAARGLEFAHKSGVIHRDIKPANLLLDLQGNVKVLDMGLARVEPKDPGQETQTELTTTGTVMGTVDYMSPEQAEDTKVADARSDVYSLGCALHYLLTGRSPYSADTLIKRILAHRSHPIPSLADQNEADPRRKALNAVFHKMVAKSAAERYQSMTEVIVDLEAIRTGKTATVQAMEPVATPASGDTAYQSFLAGLAGDAPTLPDAAAPGGPATYSNDETLAYPDAPPTKPTHTKAAGERNSLRLSKQKAIIGGSLLALLCVGLLLWVFSGNTAPPDDNETPTPNTNTGTATHGTQSTNYALAFDGIGDYVDIPLNEIEQGDEFTLEAWIDFQKQSPATGKHDGYVVPVIWRADNSVSINRYRAERRQLQVTAERVGIDFQHSETNLEISGRHHVAVVWNNERLAFYVDGHRQHPLDAIPNRTSPLPRPYLLRLGAAIDLEGEVVSTTFFRGLIDELRISKVARYKSAQFTPVERYQPDDDTIALYHCDEQKGDKLTDSSGNGHHGKLHGAERVPVEPRPNYALSFDGIDDYVEIPLEGVDNKEEFTLEAWIDFETQRPMAHPEDKSVTIADWQGPTYLQLRQFRMPYAGGGNVVTTAEQFGGKYQQSYSSQTVRGKHHVALVWQDGLLNQYVDGRRSRRLNPIQNPNKNVNNSRLTLGAFVDDKGKVRRLFRGRIDEIQLSRVARYKDEGFTPDARFEPDEDTIALFHCDEPSGDKLIDSSGNKHHGKLYGATLVNVIPSDRDRKTAEWVLANGGTVAVETAAGVVTTISQRGRLPGAPFQLTAVSMNRIDGLTHHDFARLSGFPQLHSLSLTGAALDDTGLRSLRHLPSLNQLNFSNTQITDASMSEFKRFPVLNNANISNTAVTDDGIATLVASASRLVYLSVRGCDVGDSSLRQLTQLNHFIQLIAHETKITAAGVAELKKKFPNCKVVWDDDSSDVAGDDRQAAEWVLAKGGTIRIETLPEHYMELSPSDQLPEDEFSLVGIQIQNGQQVTPKDMASLSGLSKLRNLEIFNAKSLDEALPQLRHLPSLFRCSFHNGQLTDKGLSEFKRFPALEQLNVIATAVTDDGIATLVAVAPQLSYLTLSACQVGDVSLKHLTKLRNLVGLYVDQTKVTAAGIAELKKKFPNCKVVWDDEGSDVINYALAFDGVDDYVDIPQLHFDAMKPFTVEAWLVPGSGNGQRVPFCSSGPTGGAYLMHSAKGKGELAVYGGALSIRSAGLGGTVVRGPFHVAFVNSTSGLSLFLNGRRVDAEPELLERMKSGSSRSFIGARPGKQFARSGALQDWFKGTIDELRISTIARYDSNFTPSSRFVPDSRTLALYHFDGKSPSTIKDSSGHGHDGKILGPSRVRQIADDTLANGYTERRVAEIVFSRGGTVNLRLVGKEIGQGGIGTASELPGRPFEIYAVDLGYNTKDVSDAVVAEFQHLKHLDAVVLKCDPLSKVSLQHLNKLPHLETLLMIHGEFTVRDVCNLIDRHAALLQFQISFLQRDADLIALKQMKSLQILHLHTPQVAASALAATLKDMPHLNGVFVAGHTADNPFGDEHLQRISESGIKLREFRLEHTEVTDSGLKHLVAIEPAELRLEANPGVTAAGVNQLRKSLPDCKIRSDVDGVEQK